MPEMNIKGNLKIDNLNNLCMEIDTSRYIRPDAFLYKTIESSMKLGHRIIDILAEKPTENDGIGGFKEYTVLFDYNSTPMAFTYTLQEMEENFPSFIEGIHFRLQEAINEYEDLCLLNLRGGRFDEKFHGFILEQTKMRFIEAFEEAAIIGGPDARIIAETRKLYEELSKKKEGKNVPFKELYDSFIEHFNPRKVENAQKSDEKPTANAILEALANLGR